MWNDRTRLLIGEDKLKRLQSKHVLIVGVGGVGGYAAECICRSGVERITLVDGDTVSETNINRQIIALQSTIGKPKVEVLKARLSDINPDADITSYFRFLTVDDIKEFLLSQHFDYVIDAIDSLSPKVELCAQSLFHNINIVSSMGAGGRTDPTKIVVSDISQTYNDRLARAVREKLRKQKIFKGLKVVFSTEPPAMGAVDTDDADTMHRSVRGTISYLPPMFGCMLAGEVIQDLL